MVQIKGEDEFTFLKNYTGDWPIKEYLKQHFRNQRYYCHYRGNHRNATVAAQGKGKGKADALGSWDERESGIDTSEISENEQ